MASADQQLVAYGIAVSLALAFSREHPFCREFLALALQVWLTVSCADTIAKAL